MLLKDRHIYFSECVQSDSNIPQLLVYSVKGGFAPVINRTGFTVRFTSR